MEEEVHCFVNNHRHHRWRRVVASDSFLNLVIDRRKGPFSHHCCHHKENSEIQLTFNFFNNNKQLSSSSFNANTSLACQSTAAATTTTTTSNYNGNSPVQIRKCAGTIEGNHNIQICKLRCYTRWIYWTNFS